MMSFSPARGAVLAVAAMLVGSSGLARAATPAAECRSYEIRSVDTEAMAREIAAMWRRGDTPEAMGRVMAGSELGDLSSATTTEARVLIPGVVESRPMPGLAAEIFAARPGEVRGPMRGWEGWHVFQVTHVIPAAERARHPGCR